jgi:hypothetical protein
MKYSCKSLDPAAASSVVILRDGRAMEIRRGDQTAFAEKERRFWPSLTEWMATLPDGATVVKSAGRPATGKKPAVTNPVLLCFMERVAAACRSLRPFTMRYAGTRAEVVRTEKQRLEEFYAEGWQKWKTPERHAQDLADLDGRLAALEAAGTAGLPVYYAIGPAGYITQTADGELQEVRWSKEHNAIGYFSNRKSIAWENRVLSVDFVPLTDPAMPLWRIGQGGAPMRI